MADLDVFIDGTNFSVRAGVLVVREGQLLLNCFDSASFWFTPGGRIQSGESSENAARREFQEETGLETGPLRLALIAEVFGQRSGKEIHGLEFFYVAEHIAGLPVGRFTNCSDDGVTFAWFPLEQVETLDLRPAGLKNVLPSLLTSLEVRHLVFQLEAT